MESARSRTLASFSAKSLSISGSRPAGSGVAWTGADLGFVAGDIIGELFALRGGRVALGGPPGGGGGAGPPGGGGGG